MSVHSKRFFRLLLPAVMISLAALTAVAEETKSTFNSKHNLIVWTLGDTAKIDVSEQDYRHPMLETTIHRATTPSLKGREFTPPENIIWGVIVPPDCGEEELLSILDELDSKKVPGLSLTWSYGDKILPRIARMKELQYLNIAFLGGEKPLPDNIFSSFSKHSGLRCLSVRIFVPINNVIDVGDLKGMTSLESFTSNVRMTAQSVSNVLKAPKIKELVAWLDTQNFPYDALAGARNIELLSVLSQKEWDVKKLLKVPHLRTFDCAGTCYLDGASSYEALQLLLKKSRISEFVLFGPNDKDIEILSDAIGIKKLCIFDCRNIETNLPLLSKLKNVEELCLNGCDFTDELAAVIAGLPNLKILYVSGGPTPVTEVGEKELAKITGLREFYQIHSQDTEGLLHIVRGLSSCPSLKIMHLETLHTTRDILSAAVKADGLENLLISFEGIIEDDLICLGKCKSLKSLFLFDCSLLTGKGIQHIAEIKTLESLQIVYPDALNEEDIEPLKKMPNLKHLWLRALPEGKEIGIDPANFPCLRYLRVTINWVA